MLVAKVYHSVSKHQFLKRVFFLHLLCVALEGQKGKLTNSRSDAMTPVLRKVICVHIQLFVSFGITTQFPGSILVLGNWFFNKGPFKSFDSAHGSFLFIRRSFSFVSDISKLQHRATVFCEQVVDFRLASWTVYAKMGPQWGTADWN